MTFKQTRPHRQLPGKPAVSFVASTSVKPASGASITLTVPAGASVGHFAVVGINTIASSTVTAPAGWYLVANVTADSGSRLRVYVKYLEAGEPGAARTWTQSATGECALGAMAIYSGVGAWSVFPQGYVSTSTEVLNSRPTRLPSLWTGTADRMVGIVGTYSGGTLGTGGGKPTAAPSGWTLRVGDSQANNALVLGRGIGLMDAAGGGLPTALSYTLSNASHNAGVAMALAPANPRWTAVDRIPSTIAGALVSVYSTSSSAYVPHPSTNWGYCSRTPWGVRIQKAIGNPASINYAMPGSRAADICAFAFGTQARGTEAVNLDPLEVTRAGTWNPANGGLVLTDLIGNDIISSGTSAQALRGAEWACDSLFHLLRCETAYPADHAGTVTLAGSWSTTSSAGLMYGFGKVTSTPGATWKATVPAGATEIGVVLIGGDNAAAGNTGAPFTIQLNGTVVHTGTTHNQMKATGWGANWGYVQMVVPVTGLNPATSNEIVVTHTGSSGALLMVNGWLKPKATPPWVVASCLAEMAPATYATYGFTKVGQDQYRELLRAVAARHPNVILYDPSESGKWNYSTYLVSDGVHQNEAGHAHYAREIMQLLPQRMA